MRSLGTSLGVDSTTNAIIQRSRIVNMKIGFYILSNKFEAPLDCIRPTTVDAFMQRAYSLKLIQQTGSEYIDNKYWPAHYEP